VPPRQGPYAAGWSEDAGRVMEPRNGESRGQEDIPHAVLEGKADGVHAPEGSSPGCGRARAQDTTGVGERGMPAKGERGNVGEPPVAVLKRRKRGPG
jgi:hypothetical protein